MKKVGEHHRIPWQLRLGCRATGQVGRKDSIATSLDIERTVGKGQAANIMYLTRIGQLGRGQAAGQAPHN
jgi:hypothetical protein